MDDLWVIHENDPLLGPTCANQWMDEVEKDWVEVGLESQLMRPLARVETGLGSHPALKSLGSPSQKAFKAYALDALRCRGI